MWNISPCTLVSVQDWCLAAEVVTAGGPAGFLWSPVGQRAGQPLSETARLSPYSHTLWQNVVPVPANTHARLRPPHGGEWREHSDMEIYTVFTRSSSPSLSKHVCLCPQLKSMCLSLQDSNVLVQRNMLEILLYFFPFATCLVSTPTHTHTHLLHTHTHTYYTQTHLLQTYKLIYCPIKHQTRGSFLMWQHPWFVNSSFCSISALHFPHTTHQSDMMCSTVASSPLFCY